ncbi:Retrovirus-related Pol polyprotein from type-2 retrotransposable element R2DM, partial [Gonioctena quinquepunctata]
SVNDPHTDPEPQEDQQLPTTQSNEPANEPILIVDSDESDDELAPNAEEQPLNKGDEVVVIEDVPDDPRHPVARNEARAAGTLRVQPPAVRIPRHNQDFTEEEMRIMLEYEVRYQGDGRIVKHRMGPLIQTKTLKQLRDKRAETRYKKRRDDYIAAHFGAAGPPIDPPDQPACERAASPPILRNDAAARIEMDEARCGRYPKKNSPWTKQIKTTISNGPRLYRKGKPTKAAKKAKDPRTVPQKPRHSGTARQNLWGNPLEVQYPDLGENEVPINVDRVLGVISFLEIKERISQINQSTAAGLDGFRPSVVKKAAVIEVLHLFFNLIMDDSKAENYRPITISSILSRIYFGILDQRARGVVRFSPRQKRFIKEAGCFNNAQIFEEVLRHSKVHKDLVATILDVSKAFDTVPHWVLEPALRKKDLPPEFTRLVVDAYTDVQTSIELKAPVEIRLQRGVKQGDP